MEAADRALDYLAKAHGALEDLLTAMDTENPARIEAERNRAHEALILPPDIEATVRRRQREG
jgi:hypothetical protein